MKSRWSGLAEGPRPRNIRDTCISGALRLLVTAPHPDDFDAIGCTLKFLAGRGHSLNVIVVCTGSGVEDSYATGLTLAGKTQLREREQRNSARFFGLPDNHLTFIRLNTDTEDQPLDEPENLRRLETLVLAKAPDIIFLPHGNDSNGGHRVTYSLVRKIAQRMPSRPALMLVRDPKTISMRADLYFPFGENEASWKAELLRRHDTQHQRNLNARGHGFDERILKVNRQIARELSLTEPFAEAFELELPSN